MASLEKSLRNQLERAVKEARYVAEAGAKSTLGTLGVGDAGPPSYLNDDQRNLRRRLRIHGRQLGDMPDEKKKTQEIERLIEEVAYEHWHRMLFARFLAENNLLIYPDPLSPVAVSLAECEDLAADEGARNGWELAARFAARMLPQIFRVDSPVFELELPPERQQQLEKLISDLSLEVFAASDSLGWVYQFWQARRKDEVNAAGNKIGARELPSVTQLFTEDYMVDFLLDNTLGAWHAGKAFAANLTLATTAQSEDELRNAVTLPGCPWAYLRFVKSEDRDWTPAAGTFEGWPKTANELKCLDPCMGSGHFVVAMFERLVALRMAEEKLDETAAVVAVICDNLFGLEIDPRCTQIAAFNLALAAWRRVGYCILPPMNLACSGLSPNTSEEEWMKLSGGNEKLDNGMGRLYRLFQKAAVLGSLINPRASEGDLLVAAFHELQPLLEKALAQETKDDTAHEMAVTARGLAKAAEILADQFTLVATNVPYRGCNDLVSELKEFIESAYPRGRTDLATCLFERCIELCASEGTTAVVSPQAWLFIGPYRRLREHLLKSTSFSFVAQLGKHAFATIGGEVVNVNLTAISKSRTTGESVFTSLDVSELLPLEAKAAALLSEEVVRLGQLKQLENPDARIVTDTDRPTVLLRAFADSYKGIATGDMGRFIHCFWEHTPLGKVWSPLQGRVDVPAAFGGREQVVLWENGRGQLHKFVSERLGEDSVGAWLRGDQAWQHRGIAIGQMTTLPCTLYLGDLFDENTAAVIPKHEKDLPAMWAYCQSQEYRDEVKKLDNSSLKLPNLTLIKVPFDLAHWQKVAAEKYPHGLPKPFSSDPTQWLFNGHPAGADQPLHVAVARLLGYQWPRQTGSSFPDCPALGSDGLESFSDKDGIVCIPPVRGETGAADRLLNLLAAAYGSEWNTDVLSRLLSDAGYAGKSLETWLRDGFFTHHLDIFHKRPFIWHIWDGLRDGFSALINYHKLDKKNLETLIYTYLGDWITRCEANDKQKSLTEDGERTAAAKRLKRSLELILDGEAPYDIFVRWKPLHKQPIGWEPDINDGVRMNIRPFVSVPDVKAKGAGILRANPKIKWDKDRGKEPERSKEDFPWFWGWDGKTTDFAGVGAELKGERFNDCHYTLATKQEARSRAGGT
jgi:hypothetical protein